ncbi:DEAD/DEAH box helicase [Methanoculleus sp. Wushi-C6]|uniref:DEAD/DEAH box helicase n=1 Tax=Methanoculleus caldifontis TaxID=2651577 RepID=A0ABU3X419_9EURY|nr:DEAD/DEAH box helicase [Methanoculleus sp. Wushi-C6]MDV2482800.1 DEAD/DEAH box helicase [Methanoculleus sp. Wushi-C6]
MITDAALRAVDEHWAVFSIDEEKRNRAIKVANYRLVKNALKQAMRVNFEEQEGDLEILRDLALAYEMAAIEGLNTIINPADGDDALRNQAIAGAFRSFEIERLMDLPEATEDKIYHILHLSALAYCGDRWSDLRRWLDEHADAINIPPVVDAPWDRRLLYHLFDCWLRLFRKRQWEDLNQVPKIIAGLRQDQIEYEPKVLNNGSNAADRAMALRLISFYHWAKGSEILATYMLQGEPTDITIQLDKHFESSIDAAIAARDVQLEILIKWLHAASRQMVTGSVWWVAQTINPRSTRFINNITKQQSLFELLPPQRAALREQGLLDPGTTAVIVELPTSGGKTLLAQFRILQALNQFDVDSGWIAYIAPTKALVAQITRRLRRDFEPIGIKVEHLTGAVELDTFEEDLLDESSNSHNFDILVTTPEKLQFVIRNKKHQRPLALVVMDEAQNIEDESRGLRIELLLATIKQEYRNANFLLLMPYVENAQTLARWLAQDVSGGRTISIGSTPWKPNERIIGLFSAEPDNTVKAGWKLKYHTLTTTPKTMHLDGVHEVGSVKPLKVARSKLSLSLQTAAMAKVFSERGTSIAVASRIDSVWNMARTISESLEPLSPIPEEISLVNRFLQTEISPNFELIQMLSCGVGVHHAGLSDEVRALVEWLAERNQLRVLCATTTIAQGINFPVSSVFLQTRFLPQHNRVSKEMPIRDFWNLAGRAGRIDHDSVGVIGIAAGENEKDIIEYVQRATGELASRLVQMLDELEEAGRLQDLATVMDEEQWEDFRCYVAHLWNEKKNLQDVLSNTEVLLRSTYGYGLLRTTQNGERKARALLDATKQYAKKLSNNPNYAELADTTGFSPEGVVRALTGLNKLEKKLTPLDWTPESLFKNSNSGLSSLFGVMMRVPQLSRSFSEIAGEGLEKKHIAEITMDWVSGKSVHDIATAYFRGDDTDAITNTCKAVYKTLVNNGSWGMSALSKMSGINFDSLSEDERRKINTLPAMIYHGVMTEEAVLMRMNFVPRSVAENLATDFRTKRGVNTNRNQVQRAREYLRGLAINDWERVRPRDSYLSGEDYMTIWGLLTGEKR